MQYIVLKKWRNFENILYVSDIQLLQSCTAGVDVYRRLHRRLFKLSHFRGFRWLPEAPLELFSARKYQFGWNRHALTPFFQGGL